jgi:hypothetical protein
MQLTKPTKRQPPRLTHPRRYLHPPPQTLPLLQINRTQNLKLLPFNNTSAITHHLLLPQPLPPAALQQPVMSTPVQLVIVLLVQLVAVTPVQLVIVLLAQLVAVVQPVVWVAALTLEIVTVLLTTLLILWRWRGMILCINDSAQLI